MAKGVFSKNGSNTASQSHPPYLEMISEAISTLKEKAGSTEAAIAKFIEGKYKPSLPPTFKKLLSVQLKNFTKSEKLVKAKNSYKLPSTQKITTSTKQSKKDETGKKKGVKTKRLSQVKTPEVLKKPKVEVEKRGKMKRLSQVKTPNSIKKKSRK